MCESKCSGGLGHFYCFFKEKQPPFEACCVEHDAAYAAATTPEGRLAADRQFRSCLREKGYKVLAVVAYVVIRAYRLVSGK